MKKALIVAVAAFGTGPALAIDLGAVLNAGYSAACRGGIGQVIDLRGFCRSYEVYQRATQGDFWAGIAQTATANLISGAISGGISAFGNAVNQTPEMQTINGVLTLLSDTATNLLNIPYNLAQNIGELAYQGVYNEVYKNLTNKSVSIQTPSDVPTLTAASGDAARSFEYLDPTQIAEANAQLRALNDNTTSIANSAAQIAADKTAGEVARLTALGASIEARAQTERQAVAQAIAGQNRTVAQIGETAGQVTGKSLNGNPGLAETYRRSAENAPSDRALLELQVKALADIMEQQAIYMPYIAELLVEQSKLQAMTTEQLKEEIGQAVAQVQATTSLPRSPQWLETQIERGRQEAELAVQPIKTLISMTCMFYGGNASLCE